ncbi:MAG: translation initiation factor IF-1 [Candidatus Phytoplasma cynodontis]|uniref:translation initiation factor IF-1 n=1 Tax='Cynodon dactylon' phytoplasma TaxID=295320 RepID=UPI0024530316|nr:translation initiation factor IF-1 ['Cynodon dactylon' phytoplasma]WIA07621.1 MAG: translation initiation factor IF-1 [Candidatus Phytoplasma cynodontis]
MNTKNTKKINTCDAIVMEILPNAKFKLKLLPSEKIIEGYISGKLYSNKIRILKYDKVQVDSKKRIIYRYLTQENKI